ncbi:MAG TPA: NAD(P)-binding domain-containing protein [Kofleriaceae bacterium]|nr:NAD(P)-binding domain-containing protein [Kofleriaceae bacterium]
MTPLKNVMIIGTGNVGSALASNLARHGIAVQLAGQDLAKTREAAAAIGPSVRAVEPAALTTGVDAVFLAVPAEAASAALRGASQLAAGTLVVDCTNPLRWDQGPVHTPPAEGSIAAQLAKQFPSLRVVKAFNTFGAEFHADPKLATGAADLYLAGDDAAGKQALAALGATLGFDVIDVGPLRNAAHLESLAILWIHLATVGGKTRNVAFKLLSRAA